MTNHQKELDDIEQHYRNEFDELEKHHTEEMRQMKDAQDDEISKLRQKILTEVSTELNSVKCELDLYHDRYNRNINSFKELIETTFHVDNLINRGLTKLRQNCEPKTPSRGSKDTPSRGSKDTPSRGSKDTPSRSSRDSRSKTPSRRESGIDAGKCNDVGSDGNSLTSDDAVQDLSIMSDEGLSLSQHLCESLFMGPGLEEAEQQLLADSSSRLQMAVEKLLEMLATTTDQLEQTQSTNKDLLAELEQKNESVRTLQDRIEDLEQNLKSERDGNSYLAVELHKAEGLAEGYAAEKDVLEEKVNDLEEKREALVHELQQTTERLHDLHETQQEVNAMKQEVERQRSALNDSVSGTGEEGLLQENQRLNEEKREIERQFNKDREELEKRIDELQMTIEDLQYQNDQLGDEKRSETNDLRCQIDALEKQLRADRLFIEEQTHDREQERDEFNQELNQLKSKLRDHEKHRKSDERLQQEVDNLQGQLSDRTDAQSELLLRKEQLELELTKKQKTEKQLEKTINNLEQELSRKIQLEQELKKKIKDLEYELSKQQEINDELREADGQTSTTGKQQTDKLVAELRSELDAKIRAESLANQQKHELERELEKLRRLDEEQSRQRGLLQQQVSQQLQQISELRSSIDEQRTGGSFYKPASGAAPGETSLSDIKEQCDQHLQSIELKDKEIQDLESQLEEFRTQLIARTEECDHLNAQLEVERKQQQTAEQTRAAGKQEDQTDSSDKQLQAKVDELKVKLEEYETAPLPPIAQTLLQSKNEEIEFLNKQVKLLEDDVKEAQSESKARKLQIELDEKKSELEKLQEFVGGKLDQEDLVKHLQALVDHKEQRLLDLGSNVEQLEKALKKQTESSEKHIDDCQVQISSLEKELDQVLLQNESLAIEVENLTKFQTSLQEDYDTVQVMLEEKQHEVESLSKDLIDLKDEAQVKYDEETAILQKMLKGKQNIIDEKEEELYELKEQAEQFDEKLAELKQLKQKFNSIESTSSAQIRDLQKSVDDKDAKITELQKELKTLKNEFDEQKNLLKNRETEIQILTEDASSKEIEIRRLLRGSDEEGATDEMETRITEWKTRVEEQRQTINELRRELRAGQNDLEIKQRKVDRVTSELDELRRYVDAEKTNNEQEVKLIRDEHDGIVRELRDRLDELKTELEVYKSAETPFKQLDVKFQELYENQRKQHDLEKEKMSRDHEQTVKVVVEEKQLKHSEQMMKLKAQFQQELENGIARVRDDLDRRHAEQINQIRSKHESEIQQLRLMIDGEDGTALSDIGVQLTEELANQERLDSSLLGHLSSSKDHRQEGVGQETKTSPWQQNLNDSCEQQTDSVYPDRLQVLLSRLHNEGTTVMTLAELQFIHQHQMAVDADHVPDIDALQRAWDQEKQSLLDAIQALKDLLSNTQQIKQDKEKENISDWRAELLKSINYVFTKEREALLAELRTQVISGSNDNLTLEQRIDSKIRTMELKHESSVEQVMNADRQSMLAEIRDLRAHLAVTRDEKQQCETTFNNELQKQQQNSTNLRQQVDLLNHRLAEEQTASDDLRTNVDLEKSRMTEISRQLDIERLRNAELITEISDVKTQRDRNKQALDQENERVKSLSSICDEILTALEDEKVTTAELRESLEQEQKNCEKYRDEASHEHHKLQQALDRDKLASEVSHREAYTKLSELQLLLDKERLRAQLTENQLQNSNQRIRELETALDIEKLHGDEYRQTTQRRTNDLESELETERTKLQQTHGNQRESAERIRELQVALETERTRVEETLSELEDTKRTCDDLEREVQMLNQRAIDAVLEHSIKLQEKDLENQRTKRLLMDAEQHEQTTRKYQQTTGKSKQLEQQLRDRDLENQHLKTRLVDLELQRDDLREQVKRHEQTAARSRSRDLDYQNLMSRVRELEKQRDELKDEIKNSSVRSQFRDCEPSSRSRLTPESRSGLDHTEPMSRLTSESRSRLGHTESMSRFMPESRSRLDTTEPLSTLTAEPRSRLDTTEPISRLTSESRSRLGLQYSEDNERRARSMRPSFTPRSKSDWQLNETQVSAEAEDSLRESRELYSNYRSQLQKLIHLCQKHHLLIIHHKEQVGNMSQLAPSGDDTISTAAFVRGENLHMKLDTILSELVTVKEKIESDKQMKTDEINENILRQNNELLQFVQRISEEKQELRQTLGHLEQEIYRYRQQESARQSSQSPLSIRPSLSATTTSAGNARSSSAAAADWSSERANLTYALHNSERDVNRLKQELRRREQELNDVSAATYRISGRTTNDEKTQRLYGHYLRAESYRKNLIYQKQYLISLLVNYKETEVSTLQMLATMGAYPPEEGLKRRSRRTRALMKFRSAVKCVIAISRMKFLNAKWKRVKRIGAPVVAGVTSNTSVYSPYVPRSQSLHTPTRDSLSPRQQQQRSSSSPATARNKPETRLFTTPPTREEQWYPIGKTPSSGLVERHYAHSTPFHVTEHSATPAPSSRVERHYSQSPSIGHEPRHSKSYTEGSSKGVTFKPS
ncbi:uncharacterized protein LOC141912080 isoform X3 [Tubulanus polymorphus]|uniref:uncharacterized protein LOC141912080 isoform X3 n=1 Tax=Tubulanus polymorphus TaxID=672921 RepID=UPI003DA45DF0